MKWRCNIIEADVEVPQVRVVARQKGSHSLQGLTSQANLDECKSGKRGVTAAQLVKELELEGEAESAANDGQLHE